jgi:hypothetical protein
LANPAQLGEDQKACDHVSCRQFKLVPFAAGLQTLQIHHKLQVRAAGLLRKNPGGLKNALT